MHLQVGPTVAMKNLGTLGFVGTRSGYNWTTKKVITTVLFVVELDCGDAYTHASAARALVKEFGQWSEGYRPFMSHGLRLMFTRTVEGELRDALSFLKATRHRFVRAYDTAEKEIMAQASCN